MEYGAVDREECVYMAKLAEQVRFEHSHPMGVCVCVYWRLLRVLRKRDGQIGG